ncbi:MAG: cytochrome b [Zetaproteobacteria bacterium CG12_big_fil_rev_8_21_14_0_65_54_13]|nr:MAG: cytochrome b [Zetaproteobacteria bacterium CG23_combo_of_CG06-09_8_20_14_all_54_7]PIW47964.1 MAG: cytochrome b [Zetaproteobacteria bacterium CG12_big_fil_rev_8_21_14_0_65_54_13]PIX54700.1 MAG: cytochrome b [Zetaproteobacteria bacterium CG_4_10_14_3_um_filter_54_28]PJA30959.1 MAG: cytochrome b [Zetaproteobacteria bacterium CG_4_9_14_3_um_filter_54_145]
MQITGINEDMRDRSIEVWDLSLRLFHWLLAAAFCVAWWSEGRDLRLHMIAGSIIAGLLLYRFIWGFCGDHYARFASFWPSRALVVAHLRGLLRLRPGHYIGHNPVGSLMIFALLSSLLLIALTGMALSGLQMGVGLFATLDTGFATELLIQDLHRWCLNVLLALVGIHLAGVVAESLLQRHNLIAAMITGKKKIKEVNP